MQNAKIDRRTRARVEKRGSSKLLLLSKTQDLAPCHQNYGMASEFMFPNTQTTGVHVLALERHHTVGK
jgi:hypothetical protein